MGHLDGKHALVTGGGTGVGAGIALALAAQGATVTITGRRQGPLDETAAQSPRLRTQIADVTDEAAVAATFRDAAEAAGPVDILVANAGIAETQKFVKMSTEFWRRVMTTNLDGVFWCMRAALPGMLEKGWGRVVNVSSIAGLSGFAYGGAYCASKHGVIGLTRAVADEVKMTGVTVNALCPGYVDTPIVTRGVANIVAKTGMSEDEALGQLAGANPFKRLVTVDEVATAAIWLTGPHSGAVNGQAIEIAGGHV